MDDSIPDILMFNTPKTVEECIALANSPCMDSFYTIKSQIEYADSTWRLDFLEQGGLSCLLDCLCGMTLHGPSNFSDAILQYDCLTCIRAVLSSDIGMIYLVELKDGVKKLTSALNTVHSMTKKELFEILAVLCMFSPQSFYAVLEALQHYKKETDQAHRFSILVTEINQTDTVGYKCTILTTINCLINGNTSLQGRYKIRNEFIGLGLLDALSILQKEESDDDFHIQMEAFYTQKHTDEEELHTSFDIDFQSPSALLDSIIEKVLGTSKYISFLHILQDLLKLESGNQDDDNNNSDKWQLIEDLVAKIHQGEVPQWTEPSKTKKLYKNSDLLDKDDIVDFPTVESFKPNAMPQAVVPTIHNPIGTEKRNGCNENQLSLWMCFTPSKKLKRLQWLKIPQEEIDKPDNCVWRVSYDFLPMFPNFSKMEELFFSNIPDGKQHLVTMQTLMNVTLFLNRTDYDAEDLVKSLQQSNASNIPQLTLSNLITVLPNPEEVAMLRSYQGNRSSLHPTEQFLMELTDIEDFRLLLNGHLLQAEFLTKFVKLRTSIRSMVDACKVVLEDVGLRDFLHLILGAGNYLNQGTCYGSTCGFKISSLNQLLEVKATKLASQSLLHHLVESTEENDKDVLMFTSETDSLEKAAECCLENIRNEINALNDNLKHFLKELSVASLEVKQLFNMFIEDVKQLFSELQSRLKVLRTLSHKVAEYFCEPIEDFNLQQCFQHLHAFYKNVNKCRTENFLFRKQCVLAEDRKKQIKGHLKKHTLSLQFGLEAAASSSAIENKHGLMEKILQEIHGGNFQKFHGRHKHLISTPARDSGVKHQLNFSRISFAGSQVKLPAMDVDMDETLTALQIHKGKRPPLKMNFHLKDYAVSMPKENKNFNLAVPAKPIRKTHARSRSDLTSTSMRGDQWNKYAEMCQLENGGLIRAPLARSESSFTIASLNLENQGHSLLQNEACPIQKTTALLDECPDDKPKKSERRSSFGNFMSRLSKAVLKPRNTNTTRTNQAPARLSLDKEKDKPSTLTSQKKTEDKENSQKPITKNAFNRNTANIRLSGRESRRLKNKKHPPVQE